MKTYKVITDPEAFQLLADDTRRKMVYLLRAKEMTVSQIAADLGLTPQAIYHHIRRLKQVGIIEVGREERVDHFIETYYRATAELFHLAHGDEKGKKLEISQSREALKGLEKLGYKLECEEEAATKLVNIQKRMWETGAKLEWDDRIAELENVDFFGRQALMEYARFLSMKDEEFEEYLKLHREMRDLLRHCVKAPGAKKKKG